MNSEDETERQGMEDQVRREHGFYKDQEVDVRRAGMPVDGLPFGGREATDVK